MRSVLALESVDFSKHSGVSSYFRKQYIKTGIFDIELSNIVKEAFDIRNDSDYDDYYILSKDDVEKQIENAEKFYHAIKEYITGKKDEYESEFL